METLKDERQQYILNELYKYGRVVVNDLSKQFVISKDTIRRDLSELENQGVLKRVFGGAIPYKVPVPGIDARNHVHKNEKFLIAKKALELIKKDSMIAIDGGSTNLILASLLPLSISLRVVTNSFPVANELRKRPNAEVIFIGGRCDKGSQTTVGDMAIKQLQNFHFDQCYIGVYAVDSKNGISVPVPYEAEAGVKQLFVENSDEVIAMCAVDKLEKTANYRICSINEVSKIICENPVNEKLNRKYKNKII
ncbi:DeoR/GlpR family DNA-binding transcription regulator [Anaerocolumna sp. MB42-C2]|uniref:DeoR/GlpR family DNA-binding transcription regulator n=1 Tax=Anaerocolumna sp. MB42-C2 TaxID=3070997 RepID=UPI0027DFC5D4|nr:DeoR/GlpR family DNA-binding transcription regulator [Anaerocolumna sp. MB42-C2]WMJ89094.1 DeoR/GlpR family DNA-binding transcription regulator [Anaerocolumna sp. MB42-C2]